MTKRLEWEGIPSTTHHRKMDRTNYPVNKPEKVDQSDSFLPTKDLAYKPVIISEIG